MRTKEKKDFLMLTEPEDKLLEYLLKKEEKDLFDLLHALHAERMLEFQIYSSREQWFWVPWTTFLAGALLAVTKDEPIICIGVPVVTMLTALLLAWLRLPGLKASYDALNVRHKWVVAITEKVADDKALILPLGFRSRLLKQKLGDEPMRILDDIHEKGFKYPRKVMLWTIVIWGLLILLGYLSWKF